MKQETYAFSAERLSASTSRIQRQRTLAWMIGALLCLAPSVLLAQTFTYEHVLGTDDPTPEDPNPPLDPADVSAGPKIQACDVGVLTDSGFMSNVCSFDGDANSDGGVFFTSEGVPFRSFRREDPLPGQKEGFETAVIPFGYPAVHPASGDTYLTAFFDRIPGEDPGLSNRPGGRQEGVYVYRLRETKMDRIADTTAGSSPPPGQKALWTDFSNNVAVSEAGAFFVGTYRVVEDGRVGQGIYQFTGSQLIEIVGDPEATKVPGSGTTFFTYGAVAAQSNWVVFVGASQGCQEGASAPCIRGVYAYDLNTKSLTRVIDSSAAVPGGGTFEDFAVEPETGIFHHSIATNDAGDIVLIARFSRDGKTYQGVFLMGYTSGQYTKTLIVQSGVTDPQLLEGEIESFNTVAINSRSEISFTVANKPGKAVQQGLVFYRNAHEGMRSVFKPGDTFLADLEHPPEEGFVTSGHGGMVAGSQALDSSTVPRIYFRHAYVVNDALHSMMVLATLHPPAP